MIALFILHSKCVHEGLTVVLEGDIQIYSSLYIKFDVLLNCPHSQTGLS